MKALGKSLVTLVVLVIFVSGCTDLPSGQGCGNGICEEGESASDCPSDCGALGGAPNPDQWAGWSKHEDQHGFSLYIPQDWSVEVESNGLISIGENLAQGTGAMAFVWTIVLNEGTTEEELFGQLTSSISALLPGLQVTGERYVEEYDSYVGKVEYGDYVGVLSISIDNTNAYLSGLVVPKDQYNESIDKLIRVLYSFQYEPDAMDPDSVGVVQMETWTDPNEGAFSLNVPKGWTVEEGSGLVRPYIDAGYVMHVTSPDGTMGVYVANPYRYIFVVPNWVLEMAGFVEGTEYDPSGGLSQPMLVWHYIDASDYIHDFIEPLFSDCDFRGVNSRNDLAASYQGAPWITEVTAAEERFTCPEAIETIVVLDTYYNLAGTEMWATSLMEYWAPEDKVELMEKIVNEMQETFRIDPEWAAEEQKQVAQRVGIISQTGSEINDMIMSSFELRSQTQDETLHQFSNAILGIEDVYDPDTGEQWTVPSGSEHYWQDIYGDIWGTDTYQPPTYNDDWKELYCPDCS